MRRIEISRTESGWAMRVEASSPSEAWMPLTDDERAEVRRLVSGVPFWLAGASRETTAPTQEGSGGGSENLTLCLERFDHVTAPHKISQGITRPRCELPVGHDGPHGFSDAPESHSPSPVPTTAPTDEDDLESLIWGIGDEIHNSTYWRGTPVEARICARNIVRKVRRASGRGSENLTSAGLRRNDLFNGGDDGR